MRQRFAGRRAFLLAAFCFFLMAKASTTDPPPGSHNLLALLTALPADNFHALEAVGGVAVDSAFWAGLLTAGKSPTGRFRTDACDPTAGLLAFSKRSESGVDRFVLKVYVDRGAELVLWAEAGLHDERLRSRIRIWDRNPRGEWQDCTAERIGTPRLTDLYPALATLDDFPLMAHYRYESDEVAFSIPVQEFPAEVHRQMLTQVEVPELRYQFAGGRFVRQPSAISQIEAYFYRLPDSILAPLLAYIGIASPGPGQLNPSFRQRILHRSERLRDRVFDPANGYLSFGTNSDGGGQTFAMAYWKQANGPHLVGIVLSDWSSCCTAGTLRFLRPSAQGWTDVTDAVAPSLALGDLPWLKGKSRLSAEERKLQAFEIALPRKGKDIRLKLDINTVEDELGEALGEEGIGDRENYVERVLVWREGTFGWR